MGRVNKRADFVARALPLLGAGLMLLAILAGCGGCKQFDEFIEDVKTEAPPVVAEELPDIKENVPDAAAGNPEAIAAIVGGVLAVVGGVATRIILKRRRKK